MDRRHLEHTSQHTNTNTNTNTDGYALVLRIGLRPPSPPQRGNMSPRTPSDRHRPAPDTTDGARAQEARRIMIARTGDWGLGT